MGTGPTPLPTSPKIYPPKNLLKKPKIQLTDKELHTPPADPTKVPSKQRKSNPADLVEDRKVTPVPKKDDAIEVPSGGRNEMAPSEKSTVVPVDIENTTVPINSSEDKTVTPVPAKDEATQIHSGIQEVGVPCDEPDYAIYEQNMKITLRQPILRPPKPEDNPKAKNKNKKKYTERKKEQPNSSCQKITSMFKPVSKVPPTEILTENISDKKSSVQMIVETELQSNSDNDKFSHIQVLHNEKSSQVEFFQTEDSQVEPVPAPDLANFTSTKSLSDKSLADLNQISRI